MIVRKEIAVHVDPKRSIHGSITWSEIINLQPPNSNPDLFRNNPKADNTLKCATKYIQEVLPKSISETTTIRKQTENRDRTEKETMVKAAREIDAIKCDCVRVELQERCS
jgi:hypothetical protein